MKLVNISKSFGKKVVFKDLNLDIEDQKVTVILGESGCGKSTLLSIIAGISEDYKGEVIYKKDSSFGMGYIFQEDTLIPWKTVYENIEYVLKEKVEVNKEYIKKYLDIVKLSNDMDSYPKELSGGMKRRVAIARGFAFPSSYLIMDEPFEFLDLRTKKGIIKDFKKLQEVEKKTVVFVTHDIDSALDIADRIVVFGGKPTQVIKEYEDIREENKAEIAQDIKNLFL